MVVTGALRDFLQSCIVLLAHSSFLLRIGAFWGSFTRPEGVTATLPCNLRQVATPARGSPSQPVPAENHPRTESIKTTEVAAAIFSF